MTSGEPEDVGIERQFLCREPWENYYILRRGVMPCCYGYKAIAPMSEWKTAWNSPALQEIRSYLAKGELSPYCLLSLSCPIVQRHLHAKVAVPQAANEAGHPPEAVARPGALRFLNRLLGGFPAKIHRILTK